MLQVVEVGGGLRSWQHDGVEVLAGFGESEAIVAGRGQVLAPWPNRIRDGAYEFAGQHYQLALTEPRTGNASHGLVRWQSWSAEQPAPEEITVRTRLHPQPGWSWTLDLSIRYVVRDGSLMVTWTASNRGETAAPFGFGAHPYISIGQVPLDEIRVTVPAARRLEVDQSRLLPVAMRDVAGSPLDLRAGPSLAGIELDTAYTDLARDPDGRWRVRLTGAPAGPVTVWGDQAHPWVQVFTGRAHPQTEGSTGVAIEPLTCPPDAFNSGIDLTRLEPGRSISGSWGVDLG